MHEKWKGGHIFYNNKSRAKWIKITYANLVFDYLPHKDNPYRVRLTIGGDRLPYPSDSGAPAAALLEANIIFNVVIFTPGCQFICVDIKDYFPCSPMEPFKYIKISFLCITEEILIQYNTYSLVEPDGYVYCEVLKGLYGLKQAT